MKVSRAQTPILLLISLGLSASHAYGQKPQDEARKITVTTVRSKVVTLTQQYACQIHSCRHIEVRAPSEGYLEEILVKEGQAVKKGDVMFAIGPILHQARLDAEVAERNLAQLEFNNTKKLAEKQGVSQLEVKLFEAKLAKAQARADLALAELNLTRIRTPFDGMVGRLPRQAGSFVLKGEILTTLSDNSMIRAEFNVPETRYLESMAETRHDKEGQEISLLLANRGRFPQPGQLEAIGAELHAGNAAFRADFPNPDGLLRHGQTGTVVIRQVRNEAIVIPQRATFEAGDKRYVYVVDKDNVAHRREIVIQDESEDLFVVKEGVGVGEKIVLDEGILVRDGERVETEDRQPK